MLLHVLGHGLAKSSLFVVSGRLLAAEGTTAVADVRGLLARRPGLAVPWLAGMAALLGFPPFSLFFSEVGIVLAGWTAGMKVVTAVALALLLVVSAGLFRLTGSLTLGGGSGPTVAAELPDRSAHGPRLPLLLALAVTAVVGFLAVPVGTLLLPGRCRAGGSAVSRAAHDRAPRDRAATTCRPRRPRCSLPGTGWPWWPATRTTTASASSTRSPPLPRRPARRAGRRGASPGRMDP